MEYNLTVNLFVFSWYSVSEKFIQKRRSSGAVRLERCLSINLEGKYYGRPPPRLLQTFAE